MVGTGATQLPLPVGERIEVRGFDGVENSPALYALTPLAFGESPSPPRGEGI